MNKDLLIILVSLKMLDESNIPKMSEHYNSLYEILNKAYKEMDVFSLNNILNNGISKSIN